MKNKQSLIGKFFHSYKDGETQWQGQVLSRPSAGLYLVQLFEWLMGEPSDQKLISLAEMKEWTFYDTVEEWTGAYEQKYPNRKWADAYS
jgi:hypothetical protein